MKKKSTWISGEVTAVHSKLGRIVVALRAPRTRFCVLPIAAGSQEMARLLIDASSRGTEVALRLRGAEILGVAHESTLAQAA